MWPSGAMFPRLARMTTTGTATEIRIAQCGVLKRRLRAATHIGAKPRRPSARNTW